MSNGRSCYFSQPKRSVAKGNSMAIVLGKVDPLVFDEGAEPIEISSDVFRARCRDLRRAAGTDWVAIWGDREHFGNIHYLSNFDPRFEEALLLLGPDESSYLIVGNEGEMYSYVVRGGHHIVLCQTFSLMGQKRDASARLDEVLNQIGLKNGDSVAIVGWKYPEESEELPGENYFVPAYVMTALRAVVGDGTFTDSTHLLIDPVDGMRANNEAENIAMLEWGASRASDAVARIVRATKPGLRELDIMSQMGYAGEPLTCHPMYASGRGTDVILRSPRNRIVELGDPVFVALGYGGGLSCRAGVVASEAPEFVAEWATPYFEGLVSWYETAKPGVTGGELYEAVSSPMAKAGLTPALNPGHLTATEEWVNTNVQPGNRTQLKSGMALQCDVIPAGLPAGVQLNCEDGLALADEKLRTEIADRFPKTWHRIQKRREFMRDAIGINIDDSLLPLSNTPAYFAPAFLSPDAVLINE